MLGLTAQRCLALLGGGAAVFCLSCNNDWRGSVNDVARSVRGKPLWLEYQHYRAGMPQDSARQLLGSDAKCTEIGCSDHVTTDRSRGVLDANVAIFEAGIVKSLWADRALDATWNADSLQNLFVERWGQPVDKSAAPPDCVDLFEHPKAVSIGHWQTKADEAWVFVMTPTGSVSGTESRYPLLRVALGKRGMMQCWGGPVPSETDRLRP